MFREQVSFFWAQLIIMYSNNKHISAKYNQEINKQGIL
jgi:hypothetical protein